MINLNFWLAAAIVSVLALYVVHYFHLKITELENQIAKLSADMAERDRVIEQSREDIQRLADRRMARERETLQTQMTQDDHKRVVVRFIKNL